MKELHGLKLASPGHAHIVREVMDMDDEALYPVSALTQYQLPRGRTLSEALAHDPQAPTGKRIHSGKYFSKAEIVDYLNGYDNSFASIADGANRAEIEAIKRIEKMAAEREAERDEEHREFLSGMERDNAKAISDFINTYSRDINLDPLAKCGIYFLKQQGRVVYIGQSVNVYARISVHAKNKVFDKVEFLPCERDQLDDYEGFFIRLFEPEQNGWGDNKSHSAPTSETWGKVSTIPLVGLGQ